MSLDVFQHVFFLFRSPNCVNGVKGTQTSLQKIYQKELQHKLLPLLLGWRLVCHGPVVWKNKPDNTDTGPDNSWYITFHPDLEFEDGSVHPAYVIAITSTLKAPDYVRMETLSISSLRPGARFTARSLQTEPVQYSPHLRRALLSQYFSGPPPSAAPKSLKEIVALAVPQHDDAYRDWVGVSLPPRDRHEVLSAGLILKTEDVIRFSHPVIAEFEWAHEHPEEVEKQINWVESSEEAKALLDGSD